MRIYNRIAKSTLLTLIAGSCLFASDAYTLKPVSVSANKIEENIQDVPQSIMVIDEVALEERQIKNVADVIKEIPNMTLSPLYYSSVNVRGLNLSLFTNNNPVTIYIDGVPQSNGFAYDASLANVERIEVLRGPQSSLHGKDAIGGVINIITKNANNEWSGNAGVEYGNYNTMYGTFAANGALIQDKLFLSINGNYLQDNGWIDNEYAGISKDANDKEKHNLGATLTYKPTDGMTMRLNISNYSSDIGYMDSMFVPSFDNINDYTRDNAKHSSYDAPTYTKNKANSQAFGIDYAFDSLNFSSTTTHKASTNKGKYDVDLLDNGLYSFSDFDLDSITQEFKFSSKNTHGFRWVGGLYYEHEKSDYNRYGGQYDYSSYGMGYIDNDIISYEKTETFAGFGQIMVPFAKKFELTLGGRLQSIKKEITSDYYMQSVGTPPHSTVPAFHLDAEHSWNTFLPKVAVSYSINNEWTTYASVATGYMPGGHNRYIMMGDEETNRFEPQTSIDYEIGIKGNALNNRLQLAASLFYMDIKDIHVYSYKDYIMTASNADSAHSQGIELEAQLHATDRLSLNAAVGLIQTEYDNYSIMDGYGNPIDNKGNKIERSPSYTAKVGVGYHDPNGLYGRFDVRGQGRTYYNPDNTLKADPYAVADTKIGYLFSNWDVYAYIKNITDADYITNAQNMGGSTLVIFGEPRRFGVGVKYLF